MNAEDWKRYDKRVRLIVDPFGSGFPKLRKLMIEWAKENNLSTHDLMEQYMAWKWKR
ncbi:hypothetical protein [Clostridium sp. KNHs216]|uniref:hypothetical protein n=1 Tax=Clostridium sp. KNHs216 TaxID=1550235 RepID=UPI001173955D|nr:hypothetical protein [Clostridium sp. KNHs216]TQI66281.1 hypothetical protein LY85_0942 [Clostridium sp. KNHs216]TQI69023.1 hypothetical protein LY85_3772 [Clostridium sp. KNHs216]